VARIADFVLRRPGGVFPADVLRAAALQLLDTMALAIAAAPMRPGGLQEMVAVVLYGAGASRHSARILSTGRA